MKMTYVLITAEGKVAYVFILEGMMTSEMVDRFFRLGFKIEMRIPTEFNEKEFESFVSKLEADKEDLLQSRENTGN